MKRGISIQLKIIYFLQYMISFCCKLSHLVTFLKFDPLTQQNSRFYCFLPLASGEEV